MRLRQEEVPIPAAGIRSESQHPCPPRPAPGPGGIPHRPAGAPPSDGTAAARGAANGDRNHLFPSGPGAEPRDSPGWGTSPGTGIARGTPPRIVAAQGPWGLLAVVSAAALGAGPRHRGGDEAPAPRAFRHDRAAAAPARPVLQVGRGVRAPRIGAEDRRQAGQVPRAVGPHDEVARRAALHLGHGGMVQVEARLLPGRPQQGGQQRGAGEAHRGDQRDAVALRAAVRAFQQGDHRLAAGAQGGTGDLRPGVALAACHAPPRLGRRLRRGDLGEAPGRLFPRGPPPAPDPTPLLEPRHRPPAMPRGRADRLGRLHAAHGGAAVEVGQTGAGEPLGDRRRLTPSQHAERRIGAEGRLAAFLVVPGGGGSVPHDQQIHGRASLSGPVAGAG